MRPSPCGCGSVTTTSRDSDTSTDFGAGFDAVVADRRAEADDFYAAVIPAGTDATDRLVARRAFAGLLWGKQLYRYDVARMARGRPGPAGSAAERGGPGGRNIGWRTSRWPTSSRCPTSGSTRGSPPGTSPSTASRWRTSTPTSPRSSCCCCAASGRSTPTASCRPTSGRSATSTRRCTPGRPGRCTCIDGARDHAFLIRVFTKLLLNFAWWVNRKDADGSNLFEGGFLGMDNIGLFDRSARRPGGLPAGAVRRDQLDGVLLPVA